MTFINFHYFHHLQPILSAFSSLSHHIRSRNLPSRVKIPTTPTISVSSNVPKEGNLLPQQFRRSIKPLRRKEDNMKYAKSDEMILTSKRRMDNEEDGKVNL